VTGLSKINVGLIGVGNCASSLMQGLHYYGSCEKREESVGLRNLTLGGFHTSDIEIVSAFDVDKRKVGEVLSEAVFAPPNNTLRLVEIPKSGPLVQKGPVMDGLGDNAKKLVKLSDFSSANVVEVLEESDTEIVINLLPSGAIKASAWYAEQALAAGCAFINVTPVSIASDSAWDRRFNDAKLPIVGDDLIDQVGATTLHKTLLKLLSTHGVRVTQTYQLDVGGGTESLETLERTRDVKRVLKTQSVKKSLPYNADVIAGSTDYVDFLQNRRDSYFWIEGLYFCRVPMQIDLRLSTVDAPNAGSALLDVIRAVKIALIAGVRGSVLSISSYFFKRPPQLIEPEKTEELFKKFIKNNV
jgi:myo-inositol-1-phosphate synthase